MKTHIRLQSSCFLRYLGNKAGLQLWIRSVLQVGIPLELAFLKL